LDKATFTIPAELGYGSRAVGPIPANSTLIFDVELLDVKERFVPPAFDVKGKDTLTTKTGLKYIKVQSGNGKQANAGDKVSVHYTGYLLDGTIFDSSIEGGQPITFPLGKGNVIPGWDEGIALLKVGDKVRLIIPYKLAYGEAGQPPVIPAKADLIFDVELTNVQEVIHPKPFDVAGKKREKTKSGLEYVIINKGTGAQATAGKQVSVHYTGYLPDGKIFDSSVERGQPFDFGLGQGQVIAGWDEGIALLKVGGKAQLIIPYQLGYGEQGHPPVIPAKSTLIFDVELIDVK
jgi:peptidylprolyl isomerase